MQITVMQNWKKPDILDLGLGKKRVENHERNRIKKAQNWLFYN
jgi:uncharacterized protein YkvS